ncbi:hypothetical protein BaRGS_00007561 [Batillaria attramentaria]|uniref:Uncharacterized protein n=1 Tax=Batillaria attramentaria TaxID=370345 RepID=A0ABD0LPI1_9CAEN
MMIPVPSVTVTSSVAKPTQSPTGSDEKPNRPQHCWRVQSLNVFHLKHTKHSTDHNVRISREFVEFSRNKQHSLREHRTDAALTCADSATQSKTRLDGTSTEQLNGPKAQ